MSSGGDDGRGAASKPRGGGQGGDAPGAGPGSAGPGVAVPLRVAPGRVALRLPPALRRFEPAGLSRGWGARLDRFHVWARASLERDLEAGHGFHWLVVAVALGAALYLVLPAEPSAPVLALVALGLAAAALQRRHTGRPARVWLVAAAVSIGLLAGAVEAHLVAAPRLDRERTVTVAGFVEEAETTATGGTRVVLLVRSMRQGERDLKAPPRRVTVTIGAGRAEGMTIGGGLQMLARLSPPSGPVMPGGYDFARRAWFEGRGASGFALGRATPVDLGEAPLGLRAAAALADLRHRMAERIRAALPGAGGAIAAALIVGEARAIPAEVTDWLRVSGLQHVISISGLHMTLVGGTVYAALRFLLALVPALVLRYPTRKWAAVAAFGAVTFYLLVSGGGVATNRSWIMFSVALLAVLVDRPAVTLRTVCLAALLVLAATPHAVLDPSFLMSFLAVGSLVASYELWQKIRPEPDGSEAPGRLRRGLVWARNHVLGLAFSSVVAGLATAPVIAAEFHRASPYSLVANLLALPVVGVMVMPFAVAAVLAMPFGLEALPLAVMGLGIDAMTGIARMVAGWPGGAGIVGRIHPATQPLAVIGLVWLCLWRSRWRLLGLAPIAAALLVAPFARMPDVVIAPGGAPVAVRGEDGRLALLDARSSRFAAGTLLVADADARETDDPSLGGAWRCDALGCAAGFDLATGPARIAVVRNAAAFEEDCRVARLVVSRLTAPPGCAARALVADRETLARAGAIDLTFAEIDAAAPGRAVETLGRRALPEARRLWTPAVPDPDPRTALVPLTPPRGGDPPSSRGASPAPPRSGGQPSARLPGTAMPVEVEPSDGADPGPP